jgi:hypothetical protein
MGLASDCRCGSLYRLLHFGAVVEILRQIGFVTK